MKESVKTKISKHMTKKNIIVFSVIGFVFLIILIFACSLRVYDFNVSQQITETGYSEIIINADCDVNIVSADVHYPQIILEGVSKQFFVTPQYSLETNIEDNSLIISVRNSTAYFLKDIRYDIRLSLILPQNNPSYYDVVLNSTQGIYRIENVNLSSFRASNINGRFYIYNSIINSFNISGYSGYLYMYNNYIYNLNLDNIRTGQMVFEYIMLSTFNADIIDGNVVLVNASSFNDSLSININSNNGANIISVKKLSKLDVNIQTSKSHTILYLEDTVEIQGDIKTNKGTVENDFLVTPSNDKKIKIHSEQGNIVLKPF